MAAPNKLLYSQNALWDSHTTESCLFNLSGQQQMSVATAAVAMGSNAIEPASHQLTSSLSNAVGAADYSYMSSSSLHTASMISDLVNKLVDSEDDQLPPMLMQSQAELLTMQQSAVDEISSRPLVRNHQQHNQLHQLAPHRPLQLSLEQQQQQQHSSWQTLQSSNPDGFQSANADSAASNSAAAAVALVPATHQQHQMQHQLQRTHQPHALVLNPASNYILLPQRTQFVQLAPHSVQQHQLVQASMQQPSNSLASTSSLLALETVNNSGSPSIARRLSMTSRAAQADSERSVKLSELTQLRRLLDRELRQAEVRVAAAWQTKRLGGASSVAPPPPPLSPPPLARPHAATGVKEDRELLAICQEHARLQQLVQRAERLRNGPLPAGVHSALDRLSEATRKCQTRRKEEVTSQNNRSGGGGSCGGSTFEERDSRAVSSAVGELLEQVQLARTSLWATLQMAVVASDCFDDIAGDEKVIDGEAISGVEARVFRRLEARRQELARLRSDPYED